MRLHTTLRHVARHARTLARDAREIERRADQATAD
jgi:hypothetical protein